LFITLVKIFNVDFRKLLLEAAAILVNFRRSLPQAFP
jgi:hypothetical protein